MSAVRQGAGAGALLARRSELPAGVGWLAGLAIPLIAVAVQTDAQLVADALALLLVVAHVAVASGEKSATSERWLLAGVLLGGAVYIDPAAIAALPAAFWIAFVRGSPVGRARSLLGALAGSIAGVGAAALMLYLRGALVLPAVPGELHGSEALEAGAQLVTAADRAAESIFPAPWVPLAAAAPVVLALASSDALAWTGAGLFALGLAPCLVAPDLPSSRLPLAATGLALVFAAVAARAWRRWGAGALVVFAPLAAAWVLGAISRIGWGAWW
jgi:hypothetical protein